MSDVQHLTLHGVLMNVHGIGTFIRGQSGIGKSEIALALLDRNHLLIADDITHFSKTQHEIIGTAPENFKAFMHVRGIGIINVARIFGPGVLQYSSSLQLIVNLVKDFTEEIQLSSTQNFTEIMDVKIPEVTIPISSSLNIAIVIETVVKNFLLKKYNDYDAAQEFQELQNHQLGNHHS